MRILKLLLTGTLLTSIILVAVFIYRNSTRYKQVQSTVDAQKLVEDGFKKIDIEKAHVFIPLSWVQLRPDKQTYTDVSFASELSLTSQERTLGNLNTPTCNKLAESRRTESKTVQLQSVSNSIARKGDFTGCFIESKYNQNSRDFTVRDFIIFRKERIYTFSHTYQTRISEESKTGDKVLDNIVIDE